MPVPVPESTRLSLHSVLPRPQSDVTPPKTARDAAARALTRQARRFPALLPDQPDVAALDARDAALAHAIYTAAATRWLTLTWLVESAAGRPARDIEPRLLAVLICGAAQLFFLDRLPDHAVVDESVDWAKRYVRAGAGGMTNAVLRALIRARGDETETRDTYSDQRDELPLGSGRAAVIRGLTLPQDDTHRLAIATSHPVALVERWQSLFGPGEARRLCLHSLVPAPVIINAQHAGAAPEPPKGMSLTPHNAPGHYVVSGTGDLAAWLAQRRDAWVQDPGSSATVAMLRHLRPGLIIDACAGRGTKTRQLAEGFPNAKVIAADKDQDRARDLAALFDGHPRVQVVPYASLIEWAGRADLVLLDAPCSNTGVLPRRAEARYRWSPTESDKMGALQRQIIADSIPLLAPGGRVAYATCSIDPEENEAHARWLEKWHGKRAARQRTQMPEGQPGGPDSAYRDGSFCLIAE